MQILRPSPKLAESKHLYVEHSSLWLRQDLQVIQMHALKFISHSSRIYNMIYLASY